MKRLGLLLAAAALVVGTANAFVPVYFEEAAQDAALVVLGQCEIDQQGHCRLGIVEAIKGHVPLSRLIIIKRPELFYFEPQEGRLYLIALDKDGEPYDAGIGCGTVNILGVGRNYLFTEEPLFDRNSDPVTLDDMRNRITNPQPDTRDNSDQPANDPWGDPPKPEDAG